MRKGIAISAAYAAALALTAGTAGQAAASAPPPVPGPVPGPGGVTIEIASVNGSGCPQGTASAAMSEDREAFLVQYTKYTAQAGGTSKATDARRNCQVALRIRVPDTYTYAVSSTDYRLHANLQSGAKATQKSSYYFQSTPQTEGVTFNLAGPNNDDVQFTDQVPESQLAWKPCGMERNFNVNTELRVDKGTSDESKVSSISMNSTDGSKTTYHLAWKSCA